jgi:hypothetical protein
MEKEACADEFAAGRDEGFGHWGIKYAIKDSTFVLYHCKAFQGVVNREKREVFRLQPP